MVGSASAPIPSFRAAHLVPYVGFLRGVGTPVDRLLSRARLPTLFEDDLQAYLPLLPAIDFLATASRLEGIEELGLAAARHASVSDLSPRFLGAVAAAPSLLVALEAYCWMGSLENTSVRFWLQCEAHRVKACAALLAPGRPEGRRSAEWSQNVTLVAVVRAFAGPRWCPAEMAFTSRSPVGRAAAEQFPNTRFLLGQRYTWIDLPRALLSVPLTGAGFGAPRSPVDEAGSGGGFSASLKQLLRPYLRDGYPHLELAAEIAGTSVRTLQRRLERAGLSYSTLVQQVRFDAARRLLEDPDVKMIDVAYDLGWSSPTAFTRAFRHLAGVSPREYRHDQLTRRQVA